MAGNTSIIYKFVWQWNGSETPWEKDEAEWRRYSDMENDIIEDAYLNGNDQAVLHKHYVDFEQSLQISKNDAFRQRQVRRIKVDSNGEYLREDRFCICEQPLKPFGKAKNAMSDFVWAWLEDNRHIAPKHGNPDYIEIIKQAGQGIVNEAKLLTLDFEGETIANKLIELQDQRIGQIQIGCFRLYTAESFLYKLINKTLREDDRSKTETLGAFCYLLAESYLFKNLYDGLLYRGVTLTEEMINDYQNSTGEWRRWLAFSSTSKCREKAQHFGNTLFILKLKPNAVYHDISSISYYPNEEEVLLPAATDFVVDKVECDKDGKYLIYISIFS
ncbi:unnamed protein product [Adineta steineri]|uniref:NAD(P)(+)--arginine ADP-ribosyltransferase n=1 Tax=Adineta steineri TaxID=433720 RepID=A0A816E7L6_9BILA|nr:unnamed protein product [Adineta steineri]CAF1643162.1 unnamed protein product [Adineta steineri]